VQQRERAKNPRTTPLRPAVSRDPAAATPSLMARPETEVSVTLWLGTCHLHR
ncbi:hypothetical protein KIL84_001002, partial [Mauremys mutica]